MKISKLFEKHVFLSRDLARMKWKAILYRKFFIKEMYKTFTFYNKRKERLCYPKSLQLPITNKCNLDCVMCGIQSKTNKREISKDDFRKMLSDPIFKEINSVGINGGEPFLISDIVERVEILVKVLPKLKNIYIISNGTLTEIMEKKLPLIKDVCSMNDIYLTISISVDGIGDIHDQVRAKGGTFEKTLKTISMIQKEKERFCDYLNIICTVSKYNVYDLNNIELFASENNWNISYNIATEHARLNNGSRVENFSLLNDAQAKYLAREFFFKKFKQTKSESYYAIFRYLENEEPYRPCYCTYLKSGITITPEGDICYCATHSKSIGSIYDKESIEKTYFMNENYNNQIKISYCNQCSHYIMGELYRKEIKGYIDKCIEEYYKYRI